jgi:molecular chaperone GrpE
MTTHPHDEDSRPDRSEVDDAIDAAVDAAVHAAADTAAFDAAVSDTAASESATGSAEVVEDDLDSLLTVAHRERDEYLGMLQRVQADFENYKKRMLRQQTELLERAAESLVMKVLPVLDALNLARAHMGEGGEVTAEGKALLQASSLLSDTLAKEGLELIDETDVEFDPTTHEAVEHDPAVGGEPGTVSGVLRAGYRWKGRVIRPAMVRVRG